MVILLSVFLGVVVSIGLVLCTVNLKSRSLSTLNLFLWLLVTFAVQPWYSLQATPPANPDDRLAWGATLIWALFLVISIINFGVCFFITRDPRQPKSSGRRRRRKRRRTDSETRSEETESNSSEKEIYI